jgi:hypothetical protein
VVTNVRPWTFVLSEYLDLPFLLRASGEDVVSVRSAREALDCLDHWCPTRIIIDAGCEGAEQVLAYARRFCPSARVEMQEQVITRLLAS